MSELGRHNYVTPTSYLELIAAFRQLLTEKRDTVMKAKKRYTNGLDKLAFAEAQVGRRSRSERLREILKSQILSVVLSGTFYETSQVEEMQTELILLQPKLEQAKIDNTKMMKVPYTSDASNALLSNALL